MESGTIATAAGVTVAYHVRIAATFIRRLVGLLGRRELPLDHGLLLRPGGSVHTMCMRFPIDAVFLDPDLRILKITNRLQPNGFSRAPRGTSAVLELAAGRARALALQPGDLLYLRMRSAS